MKLQLNKIVEVLSKMKNDDFYFKNYAPEIIESYADEIAEDFMCWCEENK
jgi:ribosomal protein S17E